LRKNKRLIAAHRATAWIEHNRRIHDTDLCLRDTDRKKTGCTIQYLHAITKPEVTVGLRLSTRIQYHRFGKMDGKDSIGARYLW
jgi:hypothetical protein